MSDKYEDLGYTKGRRGGSSKKQASPQDQAGSGSKSELIRITGLWSTQAGNGWSGLASPSCRLVILENNKRQKPSDPEYIAFWAPGSSEGKEESSA